MTVWRSGRLTELHSRNLLAADQKAWHLTAAVEAAAMSNVGSKRRLGRVQLKNGEIGGIRRGEANRGQPCGMAVRRVNRPDESSKEPPPGSYPRRQGGSQARRVCGIPLLSDVEKLRGKAISATTPLTLAGC